MLGSNKSSASIWTAYESMVTSAVRAITQVVKIAWKRETSTKNFGVVGTSTVGGSLVQGQTDIETPTDAFVYYDESDRALQLSYDRQIVEPMGGIGYALADVSLENTDKRFTPDINSTIGTSIFPNRPVQMYFGLANVKSQNKTLPVFKGLTKTPKEDKNIRVTNIKGIDYVEYLNNYPLEADIYTDQRTDEIIQDILTTVGFGSSQYELDTGLNTIGYAYFEKGATAGDRIRRICESEEGFFFQDEEGILKFRNRRAYASDYASVVDTIEPHNIIRWERDESTEIINRCEVIANPREVEDSTEVWRSGSVEDFARGADEYIWAEFEYPVTSLDALVANTDYKANTASDGTGTDITSDVTISVDTLFADSAKLRVQNNADHKAWITFLRLNGTPAVITSSIKEIYEDEDSVDRYGRYERVIENNFIDSRSFARYLAKAVVEKYKDNQSRIRIMVRGDSQRQIYDKIQVKDQDTDSYTTYRIMRIQGSIIGGEFYQWLTLREITDSESDSWAIVGTATVGNTNQFVGI